MRGKRRALLTLIASFALSCSEKGSPEPQANDVAKSALPPIEAEGDESCEPPVRSNEPSVEAWVAAASSIIVGTIDRVDIVDDPLVLTNVSIDSQGNEETSYEFGTLAQCSSEAILRANIHLRNVETLNGEVLGDEVTIRTTLDQWNLRPKLGAGGDVEWVDVSSRSSGQHVDGVFATDTRIGGAVVRSPVTGYLSFEFRLFEVIDDTVYLQKYSEEIERELLVGPGADECPTAPHRSMMLPLVHDRTEWSVFQSVVGEVNPDVESLRQTNEELDAYIKHAFEDVEDEGALSYFRFEATCEGVADLPPEEDPAVENDSGH